MVNLRKPIARKHSMKELNGLYFGTNDRDPVFRTIPTLLPCDPDKGVDIDGFPSVETILGSAHTIHDCWVTWKDVSQRRHRFLISFQYRPDLDVNSSLTAVCSNIQLRGELVILRGTYGNRPATIRYGEPNRLARQAVRKFLLKLWQIQRSTNTPTVAIPRAIHD